MIALFVGATIYLSYTVSERQGVLRDVVHHNDAWALSQTVQELLRVGEAISLHLLSDQSDSRSYIRLRLDIAISRMSSLQEGTLRSFLEDMSGRQSVFADLALVVTELDETLETMSEQELRQSFARLSALTGPVTGISSQSIQKSWASVEENLQNLERLHLTFGAVVAFLILCWCGLILILIRQNRLLNLEQGQSMTLNEELHAAGKELRDKNRSLEYAAHHDSLTDLPNRTLFWNELEAVIRSPRVGEEITVSLMLIDLDEFKSINDTLGHDYGDMMLQQVSERMRQFGVKAHIFCRLGGDEFACLLLHNNAENSVTNARDLRAKIAAPYQIFGRQVKIDCSIGIAMTQAPSEEVGVPMLFKRADIALYRAKTAHRDRVCLFESFMQREYDERKALEADLRVAITEGLIDVAYQIQLDVQSAELRGLEALARWTHPTRGPISPAVFIPVAEEIGLIEELGLLILTKACTEASTWHRSLMVAVNVSSLQLRSPDFVHTVQDALQTAGIDPRQLELEITETVLLEQRDDVFKVLHELRRVGVTVALDDFGTGYSSLAVLRDIPFDTIKLDKTFVRDIALDRKNQGLLELVIDLGKLLDKEVIVEGIETAEQHAIVRHLGCNTVQGFLFGHPVSASDLGDLRSSSAFKIGSFT